MLSVIVIVIVLVIIFVVIITVASGKLSHGFSSRNQLDGRKDQSFVLQFRTRTRGRDSCAFPSTTGRPNRIHFLHARTGVEGRARRNRTDFRSLSPRKCDNGIFARKYWPSPPSLHATPFSTRSIRNRFSNR